MLADRNDGHYIRYFCDCKTIANTFLLSRQHEQKARLVAAMFTLSVDELAARYPWVDYVFVRIYPADILMYPEMSKLKFELLIDPSEKFSIVSQASVFISINGHRFPAYRLVKINR